MRKCFIMILAVLALAFSLNAAPGATAFKGKVTDAATGQPIAGAILSLDDGAIWAVADIDGNYSFPGLSPGSYLLKVECLGYVTRTANLSVKGGRTELSDGSGTPLSNILALDAESLALKEVYVTAQRPTGTLGTSHTLGKDALEHLQMSSLTDMTSLLPGGKTINPDLTVSNSFSIREGGNSSGNAAFSTAVEVDGVRVGNNAGFQQPSGVDTRNIAVDNIESVEVLSGVPSAEYGDLGSGIVKVHTKTGKTPVNVSFAVNPRTYQVSASKGIDMGADAGFLNFSAEWANSTKKLTSPYESYTRRGLSLKYSNTFLKVLRFEAGVTGNLGGMNSKDDPDAFSGEYSKVKDNVLRANTSLTWLVNKSWITNLEFKATASYNDNKSLYHKYNSSASVLPSVHSEEEGYYLADKLPLTYFSDQVVDSRELDFSASAKYLWNKRWNGYTSKLKAGVQWKANGNAGRGEYYEDPSLAQNGYRPRPYSQYPYMHNLSAYVEDEFSFPFGLQLSAGLRMENVFVRGSQYRNVNSFSPRFNAKWQICDNVAIRGGWGVSEKLPSFYILYPEQQYRDIQTFAFSSGDTSSYVFYTQPFTTEYNPDLKWQRNENSELGFDLNFGGFSMSIVGFYNIIRNPYRLTSRYEPFTYTIGKVLDGYVMPVNPQIRVDNQTGDVYLRGASDEVWTRMDVKVTDRTFVKTTSQINGSPITRAGLELTMDFPEIKPIRTSLRLDAAYAYTYFKDTADSYYYNNGWSHTTLPDRSYQYVGIYANGDNSSRMVSGKRTHDLDANLTSITHIPEARLIFTCRLEMALLRRSRNMPAGSTECLYPKAYMTLDGQVKEFSEEDKANPDFSGLVFYPNNDYLFNQDGYGFYCSANISVTKEIGNHVSISFFANNFTNSRPTVYSMATGVGAIFTPTFYYGLTCRIKI